MIIDAKQPLLISRLKDKNLRGGGDDKPIWLVPELCCATGMRSNGIT